MAFIHGDAIAWSDLQPSMVESAGGEALSEFILQRGIEQRLASRGAKISDEQVDAERTLLVKSLNPDPNTATRLLNDLRERRGLGERRFDELLRRNAGLRLLVHDEVKITDAEVRAQYELDYGPSFEARLVLTDTLQQASEVVRRVRAGESFIDIALRESRDESRVRGGLLPPVNPADATFPDAVRAALAGLKPGEVSDPVAMERGFAVLKLERKNEGRGVVFDDVKGELTERVRLRVERFRMGQLARTILNESDVTVLDAGLQRSWTQQKQRLLQENR
ncbi:MAG: peptidyl-prolyl cis-trans isomerase [Planctomycetes bacterium]|nr:peptidyl-prolyl cis-trans isomerase [Planctomycetota bacterium]